MEKDFSKIEIKQYLPVSLKKQVCEVIVENSLVFENDMLYEDYFARKIATNLLVLNFYTNIEMSDDLNYDTLVQDGTINYVLSKINSDELNSIYEAVNCMIEEKKSNYNSLASVLNRQLEILISKIPEIKDVEKTIKNIPKVINKINPENLEVLKSLLPVNTNADANNK